MTTFARRSVVGAMLLASIAILGALHHSLAQEASIGSRKVVSRVAAQYPSIARTMNIEGSVKIDAVVAPNGTVRSVQVRGGHPVLVQAAQNAIRQWKWEPYPHETIESIEFKFRP